MPIEIVCTCGNHLFVADQSAGKRTKCPHCRAVVEIPAAAIRPPKHVADLEHDAQAALERVAPSMRRITRPKNQ